MSARCFMLQERRFGYQHLEKLDQTENHRYKKHQKAPTVYSMTSLAKKNKTWYQHIVNATNKCKIVLVENYQLREVEKARYHR